jgi:hypothetical protein
MPIRYVLVLTQAEKQALQSGMRALLNEPDRRHGVAVNTQQRMERLLENMQGLELRGLRESLRNHDQKVVDKIDRILRVGGV